MSKFHWSFLVPMSVSQLWSKEWFGTIYTVGELRPPRCTKIPLYVRSRSYIRQMPLEQISYIKQMPMEHRSYIKEMAWNTSGRTLSRTEFTHGDIGDKQLPEPMLSKICGAIWRHWATMIWPFIWGIALLKYKYLQFVSFPTLRWRLLKWFLFEDKDPFILHSQYCGCWSPGDTRSMSLTWSSQNIPITVTS